eukprot:2660609-Alexandrium_andersonii.AAC.1
MPSGVCCSPLGGSTACAWPGDALHAFRPELRCMPSGACSVLRALAPERWRVPCHAGAGALPERWNAELHDVRCCASWRLGST